MHLFYCPSIAEQPYLDEQESIHAIKVLRLKAGDEIDLIDGQGGYYKARISNAHHKKCEFNITDKFADRGKSDCYIHIAIAPTKNTDRTEWFVEKSVELGIDEISFINCEHSERKTINMQRIGKIAVQAMKQSIKAYLPKINELKSFPKFLDSVKEENKFIAHLESGEKKYLKDLAKKRDSYCVLIGPEGDFSPNEISLALNKNFHAVTLGKSRLRTETAGIAACHILNLINSD